MGPVSENGAENLGASVVPEGDIGALAEAISRLAGDPELRRSMAAAATLNRARLSEDTVMQLWDRTIAATLRPPHLAQAV